MRRARAGWNADAAVDRTLHLASAASRVLPPDSARERREQVAAPAPIEQHEDDRARQDDLRDLEIRVDVDDWRKLDLERDRVGRIRCQRLARVVHQLDLDGVLSVDEVGERDGSEGRHGHDIDIVQEHGDMPSFGTGSPRPGGTSAKSVTLNEIVTSRPWTSPGVGNVISTQVMWIRGVPTAGPC